MPDLQGKGSEKVFHYSIQVPGAPAQVLCPVTLLDNWPDSVLTNPCAARVTVSSKLELCTVRDAGNQAKGVSCPPSYLWPHRTYFQALLLHLAVF